MQARERRLEHRTEVGRAADRVIGELFQRFRDVAFGRGGEAVLRVDDAGRDVERDDGEVIVVGEGAQGGLCRRDA